MGVMKDEELNLEEIEDSLTLGGTVHCYIHLDSSVSRTYRCTSCVQALARSGGTGRMRAQERHLLFILSKSQGFPKWDIETER